MVNESVSYMYPHVIKASQNASIAVAFSVVNEVKGLPFHFVCGSLVHRWSSLTNMVNESVSYMYPHVIKASQSTGTENTFPVFNEVKDLLFYFFSVFLGQNMFYYCFYLSIRLNPFAFLMSGRPKTPIDDDYLFHTETFP